tara:strand:+ start:198 stop:464 length:267 start_codon:yes stop_codon:yes gene_type:complete
MYKTEVDEVRYRTVGMSTISVKHTPTWWGKLLRKKEYTLYYYGSGMSWTKMGKDSDYAADPKTANWLGSLWFNRKRKELLNKRPMGFR